MRASFGGEALAQRAYRECAEHYGFLIDPTRPRTPEHKGKVEQGGVHYVTRHFLAGRDPEPIDALNARLRTWTGAVAGRRIHGTTKEQPLARFEQVERTRLLPLPRAPYDPASWKELRVYRDCYLSLEGSYYSVPHRLVGQRVWVRAGARAVQVYGADHQLLATHDRAQRPGQRLTQLDHLPQEKVPGLTLSREGVLLQAAAVGPATTAAVQALLAHRPEDRLRSAGRLVRLAQPHGSARLERACQRALRFGEASYPAVKRILDAGLEAAPLPEPPPAGTPGRYTFVRQVTDFVASLAGAGR